MALPTTPKRIGDTEFRTGKVRLSFLKAFVPEPKRSDDGSIVLDPAGNQVLQYSVALIIPKSDTATVDMLKQCMRAAADKKFGGKLPPKWANGLRDGDSDPSAFVDPGDTSKGVKPELKGCYWINCSSKNKPVMIDGVKDEFTGDWKVLTPQSVKSGDYARVQINCFGFDVPTNKGVSFGFACIQKLEDGEALSGGGFNAEAFDDEEVDQAFS